MIMKVAGFKCSLVYAAAVAVAVLLFSFPQMVSCEEEDVCTQGLYDRYYCELDEVPYSCRARFADSGTCISDGLCCCESRDGYFASGCQDGDICCDGGCCDPKKSFCCGGGCCDQESEVCCRGNCVGKASGGTRIAVPVLLNLALAIVLYCMVIKSPEDLRMGRLTTFMLLLVIVGVLQVVVALSAWDCSPGLKFLVALGVFEVGVGLVFIAVRMIQAKSSGVGVLAAFTLERFVIVAVNEEGELLGVAVADEQTMVVAKKKLGEENTAGNVPRLRG